MIVYIVYDCNGRKVGKSSGNGSIYVREYDAIQRMNRLNNGYNTRGKPFTVKRFELVEVADESD